MRLKRHQIAELFGIFLLLASTAGQMFYLEPLKREIEWRLVAFTVQQSAQEQIKATYDSQIEVLKAVNAPADSIAATAKAKTQILARYTTADANISDFMVDKENVENYLELIVIALFALGSLMAGIGRVIEIKSSPAD